MRPHPRARLSRFTASCRRSRPPTRADRGPSCGTKSTAGPSGISRNASASHRSRTRQRGWRQVIAMDCSRRPFHVQPPRQEGEHVEDFSNRAVGMQAAQHGVRVVVEHTRGEAPVHAAVGVGPFAPGASEVRHASRAAPSARVLRRAGAPGARLGTHPRRSSAARAFRLRAHVALADRVTPSERALASRVAPAPWEEACRCNTPGPFSSP